MLFQKTKQGLPQKGSVPPNKKEKVYPEDDNVTRINIFTISIDIDGTQDTKGETTTSEILLEKLRLDLLFWLSLQKFVEIGIVFLLTLLAIKWPPLFFSLQRNLFRLLIFIIFSVIAMFALQDISFLRPLPRWFVSKVLYMSFLTALFFLLAIHFPILSDHLLNSHFALLAAGITGITYLTLMLISLTIKPNARGWGLRLSGMLVPTIVSAFSQPFYFYFAIGKEYDVSYFDFMRNIAVALFLSIVLVYEVVFVYHKFVTSNQMETRLKEVGLLPDNDIMQRGETETQSGIGNI